MTVVAILRCSQIILVVTVILVTMKLPNKFKCLSNAVIFMNGINYCLGYISNLENEVSKKHTITKQTIQGSTELASGFCQIRKDIDNKTFKTRNRMVDKQVRHIHSEAVALLTFKTNSLLSKIQLSIKSK